MKIYFIRHGKTQGNLEQRYVGTEDLPVCEEGLELLRQRSYPAVQMCYVSPMLRCRQTQQVIYGAVPYLIVPELRECDFGDFEGKSFAELADNADYQAWLKSGELTEFPHGDTLADFTARCVAGTVFAVRNALEQGFNEIALVAHGGVLMAIFSALCAENKQFWDYYVANGCGYQVEIDPMPWLREPHFAAYQILA